MGAAAKSALKKIAEKNYKETLEKRNRQKKIPRTFLWYEVSSLSS